MGVMPVFSVIRSRSIATGRVSTMLEYFLNSA